MKNLFRITAITAAMLNGAVAAELPTFELMGFPITSHQVAVLGSAHVQEQTPNPTLTLGGLPASPHQIAVLTPLHEPRERLLLRCSKTAPRSTEVEKLGADKPPYQRDVRLLPETSITRHVRFTPKSGHVQRTSSCLLWAKSGLMQRSKKIANQSPRPPW